MTQLIIGLKVDSYKSFAECAKIIRQFQKYSYSEIKKHIDEHDYVLCYACTDDSGVKNVIRCYELLTSIGSEVSLYELDHRRTTIEHVRNRDRLYDDISRKIDSSEE